MIYALYGSDTYRSRKKMNQIIAAFRAKAGSDFNMHRFDAEDDDISDMKAIVGGSSLFAAKKLSVIEYAFCESVAAVLFPSAVRLAASQDQVVILWDKALDTGKKKYFKEWEKFFTKSQEFNELSAGSRQRWIAQEADERGIVLRPTDMDHLMQQKGDSWTTIQLLEKCAVGGDIHSIFPTAREHNVFSLGDAFFSKNREALRILHELRERGEDEFGLFSYLANRSRLMVAVKACDQEQKQIPSWLGMHPFVAKKTSQLSRALSLHQCRSLLLRFFEEDSRIKIGLAMPADSLIDMILD